MHRATIPSWEGSSLHNDPWSQWGQDTAEASFSILETATYLAQHRPNISVYPLGCLLSQTLQRPLSNCRAQHSSAHWEPLLVRREVMGLYCTAAGLMNLWCPRGSSTGCGNLWRWLLLRLRGWAGLKLSLGSTRVPGRGMLPAGWAACGDEVVCTNPKFLHPVGMHNLQEGATKGVPPINFKHMFQWLVCASV